ncbi:hypothetical protein Hte_000133 [Hypoxylon texense]
MAAEDLENHAHISVLSIPQQRLEDIPQEEKQPSPTSYEDATLDPPLLASPQDINNHSDTPPDENINRPSDLPDGVVEELFPIGTSLAHDSSQDTGDNEPTTRIDSRLPVRQSLGLAGCLIIFGGSVLTILVTPQMAFLVFLWTPAAETTVLGRQIALRDWATRAVTLSSLVLRSVIAVQTTVCTSLVAALLIERRQIRLSQVTRMSIIRSVNNGPYQLLQDLISSKSFRIVFNPEVILLVILAIGVLGIQFGSTILLTDLKPTSRAQDPVTVQRNVSLSFTAFNEALRIASSSWQTMQGSTALFGESGSQDAAEPNEYGVSHSGPKLRALLPFEHEDRARMRSFRGPALTLTTEVLCLRPSISNFQRRFDNGFDGWLAGDISLDQTFRDAGVDDRLTYLKNYIDSYDFAYNANFNCTLPVPQYPQVWKAIICQLQKMELLNLKGLMDSVGSPTVFLTFVADSVFDILDRRGKKPPTPIAYGEWNGYEVDQGIFFNISLCFSIFNTTVSEVEMASSFDLEEPEFKWSLDLNTPSLTALQKLMGANAAYMRTDERGVFDIEQAPHPISPSVFADGVNPNDAEQSVWDTEWVMQDGPQRAMIDTDGSSSLILCTACLTKDSTASKDGGALFMQIVNSSNRVAVATDAYITRLVQNFYYLLLPLFDIPVYVEVVFSTQVSIPRQWNGLIAVLVMVSITLVCIWIITALYVRNARYTRQGDIWHAVSQLMAEPTQSILQQSNELGDKEVVRMLKGIDPFVTVSRSAETGRVEVREVC